MPGRPRLPVEVNAMSITEAPVSLSAQTVRKEFGGPSGTMRAVDDVSLAIRAGEFVTILGPSGCGKSTFLHMVGGFDQPSAGAILHHGRAITAPGPDRGMMFQDLSLFPWLTVTENVRWPLDVKRLPNAEKARIVEEVLTLVHLESMGNLYPAQLSGGMRQRTALARLLALDPEIMLMDEPFGALDSQTRELLQEELQSIWRRKRKTVLFVTHDIDEAIYLGTRLIVFTHRPGRIKADLPVPHGLDRDPSFRTSPEFTALRIKVWEMLREEMSGARSSYA
jgi:NitT/TauT family transport system ATP-binding protein